MKVVAYFAISADGFIAGEHDDVSWVSKNSWDSYKKLVENARYAVVGRRTYDLMKPDEFIDDCRYLVLSSSHDIAKKHTDVEVSDTPKQALDKLKASGHQCAAVIGGAKTFSTLMRDKLIDELFLDIEPVLLGSGVRLFEGEVGSMTLLETLVHADKKTVQLHYKVHRK